MSKEMFKDACMSQNVNVALNQLRMMNSQEILDIATLGRHVLGYVAQVKDDQHFLSSVLDILEEKGVIEALKEQHGADGFGATPWFNHLLWNPLFSQQLKLKGFDFDFPMVNGVRYIENIVSRGFEAGDDLRLQNLIECGASLTAKTKVSIGGLPVGESLLTISLLNNNPSHSMALLNNNEVVQNINTTNLDNQSASDWAIYLGGNFAAQPAIHQRLKAIVIKMKEVGADIDHKYPDGSTYLGQLTARVLNGQPQQPMIKFAADAGADVNEYLNGRSIFASLCSMKPAPLDTILALVNSPTFDVTTTDQHGFGVAAWVMDLGGYNVVTALKVLVAKGASLTMRDTMGLDPASWAALYGNKDALEYLQKQGVPFDNMSNVGAVPIVGGVQIPLVSGGFKPVHLAAIKGNKAVLDFFMKSGHGTDLTCEEGGIQRSVLDVAEGPMKALVTQLNLKYNVVASSANPINAKDVDGLSPFSADCVADKHEDAAAKIATPGFNPNVTTRTGENSLHSVLNVSDEFKQDQLIDSLVAAKADLNSKDKDGATPVAKAISLGKVSAAKHLLEAKADPMIPQNDGSYPIHLAAQRDMDPVADAILNVSEKSAIVKTSNPARLSPLQVATSCGAKDVIKELMKCFSIFSSEDSALIKGLNDVELSTMLDEINLSGQSFDNINGAAAGGAGN